MLLFYIIKNCFNGGLILMFVIKNKRGDCLY